MQQTDWQCALCGWWGPEPTTMHPSGGIGCPSCVRTEGMWTYNSAKEQIADDIEAMKRDIEAMKRALQTQETYIDDDKTVRNVDGAVYLLQESSTGARVEIRLDGLVVGRLLDWLIEHGFQPYSYDPQE